MTNFKCLGLKPNKKKQGVRSLYRFSKLHCSNHNYLYDYDINNIIWIRVLLRNLIILMNWCLLLHKYFFIEIQRIDGENVC